MDFLSGSVLTENGFVSGYVSVDDGRIAEICSGKCPGPSVADGLIMPRLVNPHTHCADGGVKVVPGLSLQDLVAPPDGLKHVYLRNAPDDVLSLSMSGYSSVSEGNGIGKFIDFREGGVKGCRLLRNSVPSAVILGRPISTEYDSEEVDSILDVADGIGLSSISDVDLRYAELVADHVHRRNKIFAMHASERIREDIEAVLSLDPRFIVHMTEATDRDIVRCTESGVPIVVCPRSNIYFGKFPPLGRMFESGAEVCIGTDNAMLCEPDLRAETAVFTDVLESQGGDSGRVWENMVVNGRKILYDSKELSLRVGMDADLTIFPCSGGHTFREALSDRRAVVSYRWTHGG